MKIPFNFKQSILFCYKLYSKTVKNEDRLYDFVNQRLKSFLIDQGLRYDIAEAILHLGYINISYAVQIGKSLEDFRSNEADHFKKIVETAVRVKRLAVKSNSNKLSSKLFKTDSEKISFRLLDLYNDKSKLLDIKYLFELSSSLVIYFEEVMVMDKNKEIQKNRLSFMRQCDDLYLRVADFEKIVLG